MRTGTLLAVEGTGAFGGASLALLRFAHGPAGVAVAVGLSVVFWLAAPVAAALARLRRADI